MLYLMLICSDPNVPFDADEPRSLQPQHAALEQEMRNEGVYVSGAGLMPPELAPAVRVKDGAVVTDGPFAESKELAGGYYIVDCKDEADAIRQAARIPVSRHAWIQVRQIALFHPNAERLAKM